MKKFIIIVLLFTANFSNGEGDEKQKNRILFGEPSYTYFNINNISTFIYDDGRLDMNLYGNSGFMYPKGEYKWRACVYQSGFVWGGKINGQIRAGGSLHRSGLKPGKILSDGTAEDPGLPNVRVYRVRLDYEEGSMQSEINDYEGSEEEIREQYRKDWYEWPASDGAPFEDVNLDGLYNPEIDIPGIPGADQTIWYVANDLHFQTTKDFLGSIPLNFEVQVTVWGYNLPEPIGNMMFRKYIVINKNKYVVEDMYFGAWSDPDIGDASDDYVGCDTLLNMGFVYNGWSWDAQYEYTPPAVGFQILQGPITDGASNDTANFMGQKIPGKKNIPMTAFGYIHKCCSPIYGDPRTGDYTRGTLQLYNYLQGKDGFGNLVSIPDELGGGVTQFPYSGDPITGEGFLLNNEYTPADYRLMPSMGPFNMMPGDTQEVIIAQFAAGAFEGCSNMGSLGLLKNYAKYAQYLYDYRFDAPKNFPKPEVTVSTFEREIILTWGSDREKNNTIENYAYGGYTFQGYKVYQFESKGSKLEDGILLAAYDKVDGIKSVIVEGVDYTSGLPITYVETLGTDSGLEWHIQIKEDLFNNIPLNDGTNYYFGVTANYIFKKGDEIFDIIETAPEIISAMPQGIIPGVRYEGIYGEEISVNHTEGVGDGKVIIIVHDPALLTGHDYKITFENNSADNNFWNLIDLETGEVVLNKIAVATSENDALQFNGLSFLVVNSPNLFAGGYEGAGIVESSFDGLEHDLWYYNSYYEMWFSEYTVWRELFFGINNPDEYYVSSGSGKISDVVKYRDYTNPRDFELRFTDEGGYAVYAFEDNRIAEVPFELWDIGIATPGDYSDDIRMIPFLISNDDSTKSVWGWATGIDKFRGYEYPSSDRIFWADPEDNSFGTAGYDKFAEHCEISGGAGTIYDLNTDSSEDGYYANLYGGPIFPISDITICDYDFDGLWPPSTTVIRFITSKPFTSEDVFTFTSPGVIVDKDLEIEDVDKISMFPNPYYAHHPNEPNQYQNYVMFNHLPQRATFRIFNLAGHLVRTLHKDDDTQFYLWDLQNENRLLAPSGLYIIYIEMPDLQKVKVLKLAIVQREVVPGNF